MKYFSLEPVLKYLFAALLIFVPLYPKFPLFNIQGTYVAVRAEDFLLAILGLLLLIGFLKYRRLFLKSRTVWLLLTYFTIGLLSVVSGIFVTKTIASPTLGLLHWARRIEYALPFFGGIILMRQAKNLKFIMEITPLVALGVFAYGIAQIFFEAPVIITQNEEYSKGIALTLQPGVNLASTFAGHYDLATYLVMIISILVATYFALKLKWLKLLSVIFLLCLFWMQLRTGSRIAFFALMFSVSTVLVMSKKPLWIIPVYLIGIIGMANTPSIAGRFGNLINVLQFRELEQKVKGAFDTRRVFIITKPVYAATDSPDPLPPTPTPEPFRAIQEDRSTSIRVDVEWPRAIRALKKNILLGTGFSSISLATDNDYLRALGESGLLGFLAFSGVIISLLADIISGLKKNLNQLERQYLIGAFSAMIGFLIIASFIDVFEASKVATLFWLYSGLATGLLLRYDA